MRKNLDELFYRDTLYRLISTINTDDLTHIYGKEENETDDQYYERLTNQASNLFWGYSISHVSGRYRTGDEILTKIEAAKKIGKAYLVDETTAIVRFIFPYEDGQEEYHSNLDQLFHVLFVKVIIEAIRDEDEIWLLESMGNTVLHKYVKTS